MVRPWRMADQERGLLKERAAEVSVVLSSSMTNVSARLNLAGTVARLSNGSAQSFAEAASAGDRNLVGQGVSAADARRLRRRAASTTRRYGGTGLGLASSRRGATPRVLRPSRLAAGPGMAVGQTVTGALFTPMSHHHLDQSLGDERTGRRQHVLVHCSAARRDVANVLASQTNERHEPGRSPPIIELAADLLVHHVVLRH